MSEPEVTITLGRTGQVVTKGGKQSRVGRFGSDGDGSFLSSANKRHRGDGIKWNPGLNRVDGSRIARNDLRLKLMRKRLSNQIPNDVEERENLDRRKHLLKGIRPAASSYTPSHRPEPSKNSLSRQIFPQEIRNDLHRLDSFYSSQSIGGSETSSSDRILKSSSRFSPPRSFNEVRRVASMRATNAYRGGRLLSNEVIDASRLTASPITIKATSQVGNVVTRAAPTNSIIQNVPFMGDEPLTVAGFLQSLGLGKYVVLFQAEEVDMTVLKQMKDTDLKEMGIPMGPRKKILLSLLPHQKRQISTIPY